MLRKSILLIVAVSLMAPQVRGEQSELLTVGSKAPPLHVEHWLSNGNGKFQPVTQFEPGKIYVVEFWATWCGPCIQSMPHLAQLQKEYADKGVQIISISDEDLETVQAFLKRKTPQAEAAEQAAEGEKTQPQLDSLDFPKTFGELTSAYCLTTDPDGSSQKDYMEAAAQNGIPTAFIVGRDGVIEWIGHPMEMDGPLAQVVAGTWDRKAFAEKLRAEQEAEKAMQDIFQLLQNQEFDQALSKLDEAIKKSDSLQLKVLKLQILLATEKTDAALAQLDTLYKDLADQPEMINMLAWNLYQMADSGQAPDAKIMASIEQALREAIKSMKGGDKASALDTLAHLLHQQQKLDEAISLEEQALELSEPRDREFIQDFLNQLKSEKAGNKSSDDSESK
ncbi:MAG: TlpA family protein disulfide reductase [Planctomycetota bacterium]|nr:MAG: TlpA family protein disulfide reductase [Planctomycetota bacterium]